MVSMKIQMVDRMVLMSVICPIGMGRMNDILMISPVRMSYIAMIRPI